MSPRAALRLVIPAVAVLLAVSPGCNRGHHHSGTTGTVVVQITNSSLGDLSHLTMKVSRVTLFSGGKSVQMFPAADSPGDVMTVDLSGAIDRQTIGVSGVPSPGSFVDGLEIAFQDLHVTKRDAAGNETDVAVTPASGTARTDFDDTTEVTARTTLPLLFDFGSGPTATLFPIPTDGQAAVNRMRGEVSAIGVNFDMFVLAPGPAPGTFVRAGETHVLFAPNMFFVLNGGILSPASGLELLEVGDAVVVTGVASADGITATRIIIEKPSDTNGVRLEGTILSKDCATNPCTISLHIDRIDRDANAELGSFPVGSSLPLRIDPSTDFTSEGLAGTLNISSLFPGSRLEVIGAVDAAALKAAFLDILPSTLAGTLTDLNFPARTGAMTVTAIDGIPTATFTAIPDQDFTDLPLLFDGVLTGLIGGVVGIDPRRIAIGQAIEATGFFTQVRRTVNGVTTTTIELAANSLSLPAAGPFSGTVLTNDGASQFTADVNGTPTTVVLRPDTRLGVRREGAEDLNIGVDRAKFLSFLSQAAGPVQFSGFQDGSIVQAVRADVLLPPQ